MAGMLIPMENVSVAKRTLMSPSPKRISTTSFSRGRRPPWWIPMPRFRRGRRASTWGSVWSDVERVDMAFV